MPHGADYDVIIVGGGFYGCCLALTLRSVTERILVIEQEGTLLSRASRANQARIHSGFHYPRSFVTAKRSQQLRSRFVADFAPAIVDDFRMLYAVARRRSKVSARRFFAMFSEMGAPIAPASRADRALFAPELIEDVFDCREAAFDCGVLRDLLADRLARYSVAVRYGAAAERVALDPESSRANVLLRDGTSKSAGIVFNVTYAGLNTLLRNSALSPLGIKLELAEIALVTPPPELRGKAVTVMDGPFFSLMPYPARQLYSMTHVRYTPHASRLDTADDEVAAPRNSRWRHMRLDAQRYLPCAANLGYSDSIYDTKAVLLRNEADDGRPILLHAHSTRPGFYSIMGGKIDNIYDLFEYLPGLDPRFAGTHAEYLLGIA